MTFKERYDKLKAEHRCVGCGAKLPVEYTMIRCEHCLEYSRSSHRRKDELKKRKQAYASQKPRSTGLTISQVVKMAAERHISYGEMVLIIEKGDVKA